MTSSSGRTFAQVAGTLAVLLFITLSVEGKKKDEKECEVCIHVLTKFKEGLTDDQLSDQKGLDKSLRKFCKGLPKVGNENRFCYFIGGTEDAATSVIGEITRPMSFYMPVERICLKLKNKISEICDLKFHEKPDFTKLSKMRVGELKRILSGWGQDSACKGCVEKSDYVNKVRELLPKHDPEEYKKLLAFEKSEL